MKAEVKEKWLSDLRSGEFDQGIAYLCQNGNYCCLGVLLEGQGRLVDTGSTTKSDEHNSECISIPHNETLRDLNLEDDTAWKLTELNDVKKLSFNKIADWIEENIPVDS